MGLNYKKILTALGVATGLIVTSTPAHAGFIAPIIGAVGAALGIGTVAATVVTVVAAVAAVAAVGYAVKAMTPTFDVPDYSSNTATGANAVNSGILINKVGTNESIPVVYGYRKIGGIRVYASTTGTDNKDLYIVMVFAEGQINAYKQLFFDDKLVAEGGIRTDSEGGINFSAYSKDSRLRYELQSGSDGQTPPSWFTSGAPGWGSNHKLSGLAVGYFRCRWIRPDIDNEAADQQATADANPYSGIPKIQVVIEGKKTPTATSFSDGETTAYSSMTKTYSTNPADHMLDYLLNDRYGRGLDNNRIGFTSFNTAAQKFNTTVSYKSGGNGKILENNMVIQTDRTMLENVQTMLQNMRSGMPYVQGKFNLKLLDSGNASDPTDPNPVIAYAVTEREIIGGIQLEGKGNRDQYNQVKAVFPSPAQGWELDEVVYPEPGSPTDTALLAEDNGKRFTKEISLEGVINPNLASDIANIVLQNSRKKKTISFVATAELHDVVVGDIITVTYASLGMSAVKYRVTSHHITAEYEIEIGAIEHDPTNYDFTNVDVYVPKPLAVSVTQPTVGAIPLPSPPPTTPGKIITPFPITGGPPITPVIGIIGPSIIQDGVIASATHVSTNSKTTLVTWHLTYTHAVDTTMYNSFSIDIVGAGTTQTPTEDYFKLNGTTEVRANNPPYATTDNIGFYLNQKKNNSKYIFFRIRYRRINGGGDVLGPWKQLTNVTLGSAGSYP